MPRAGGHPRQLQRALPAGRRLAPVRDGADEPAARRRTADYVVTGVWSQKALKEAKKVGSVARRGRRRGRPTSPHPDAGGARARPGRRVRALHLEQHDLRHRVASEPEPPPACRSSATPRPTCSAGRSTSRSTALIYAGAQKNLGPAGVTLVIVREDLLERAAARPARRCCSYRTLRRGEVALQHAAHLRDLRHGPRLQVAEGAGRARGDGASATRRRPRLLYDAIDGRGGFYRGTAQRGQPLAHERHLPPADEELEKRFVRRGRPRRGSTASRATARSAACARRSTTPSRVEASTRSWRSCRSSSGPNRHGGGGPLTTPRRGSEQLLVGAGAASCRS